MILTSISAYIQNKEKENLILENNLNNIMLLFQNNNIETQFNITNYKDLINIYI